MKKIRKIDFEEDENKKMIWFKSNNSKRWVRLLKKNKKWNNEFGRRFEVDDLI